MQRTRCPYFYRHGERLQQARARLRLCDAMRRPRTGSHAVLGWSEQLHRHPSVRLLRPPRRPSTRWSRSSGPKPARRSVPLDAFHLLPGDDARRARRVLLRGRVDHRRDGCRRKRPPSRATRALPQGPRPHLLCLCGRIGGSGPADRGQDASSRPALLSAAWHAKPWRAREAEALLARRSATTAVRTCSPQSRRGRHRRRETRRQAHRATTRFKIELARRIVGARTSRLAAAGTPERVTGPAGLPLRLAPRSRGIHA